MKKTMTLFILSAVLSTIVFAQFSAPAIAVSWSFSVLKPGSNPGELSTAYPGAPVTAAVTFKDADGNTLYTETHTGQLDQLSHLRVMLGAGQNPIPPERLSAADYAKVKSLCWTLNVTTPEGDIILDDMQMFAAAAAANYSREAGNAERFGNNHFFENPILPAEFLEIPDNEGRCILGHSRAPGPGDDNRSGGDGEGTVFSIDITDFIGCEKSIGPDGEEIDVLRIDGFGKPVVFGSETPGDLENYYTFCTLLGDLLHVFAIKVLFDEHSPSTHNTAAIFADNTERVNSAGILANAQTWGVYGTGANGTVGISTGTGNGAGAWGQAAQAPTAGGFKYALYGQSQNFTGAWGAAVFGNGFHTGTWMMSSDARLKTEIRSQTNTLDRVMKLRPAQYRFKQDTPYGLPDGIHHGFIAQEMETIFPELVSDITMPLSTDPQDFHTTGTVDYKGVNYIEMIAILTSALQELNTSLNVKIDAQAAEITALRTELENALGQKH